MSRVLLQFSATSADGGILLFSVKMEELVKSVSSLTSEISNIKSKLDEVHIITDEVRKINGNLQEFEDRVTRIEGAKFSGQDSYQYRKESSHYENIKFPNRHGLNEQEGNNPQQGLNPPGTDPFTKILAGDVQGDFKHLKTVYQNQDSSRNPSQHRQNRG